MELKTKYALGDILYLCGYGDEKVTGHITGIQLKDYYGQVEIGYKIQIGHEVVVIDEQDYGHNNGEPYYNIVSKVGNIHLKSDND